MMLNKFALRFLLPILLAFSASCAFAQELSVTHGFAANGDVKIHYVTAGEGPLVVMLHGFPDYWYTWRKQIPALAKTHKVVAIDLRGFNKSDKPEGVESYSMPTLVSDVESVIRHFDAKTATVIGHDWGGMIAWSFAMLHPEMTERLVILNLPHPACLTRELANNPAQQAASAYARFFQQPEAAASLSATVITSWVRDVTVRKTYIEAMQRSSFEAMLNYYKANYPREPYTHQDDFPTVVCPVLMIHGLKDTALLQDALNGTWQYLEKPLTLVTVPDADHFVQQAAPELVTRTITRWLEDQQETGAGQ